MFSVILSAAFLTAAPIPHTRPIPPCGCGCMETGECRCKNCAERTADPTFRAGGVQSAPCVPQQMPAVVVIQGGSSPLECEHHRRLRFARRR